MQVILDARKMTTKMEAHAYLKEMFGFPDYYGNNLDALYDCLEDMEDVEIVIEHEEEAGEYYARVKDVIHDSGLL